MLPAELAGKIRLLVELLHIAKNRGGKMGKAEIQYKLIKTLAFSPWIYTDKMLAGVLGVSKQVYWIQGQKQ